MCGITNWVYEEQGNQLLVSLRVWGIDYTSKTFLYHHGPHPNGHAHLQNAYAGYFCLGWKLLNKTYKIIRSAFGLAMTFYRAVIHKTWTIFRRTINFFDIFALKEAFLVCFYPLTGAKNWGAKIFCRKVKLFVHTLLTSHHTSNLDLFWARYHYVLTFLP